VVEYDIDDQGSLAFKAMQGHSRRIISLATLWRHMFVEADGTHKMNVPDWLPSGQSTSSDDIAFPAVEEPPPSYQSNPHDPGNVSKPASGDDRSKQ
jgi:hypothetical protein